MERGSEASFLTFAVSLAENVDQSVGIERHLCRAPFPPIFSKYLGAPLATKESIVGL